MKVWPFVAALAEGGCKPPHAALAEDRRGERCGKGARDASGGDREDGAQSSFSGIAGDVSLLNQVTSEPGRSRAARDESGGCPFFWPGGVRPVGDVSPVCGFCMERGKARLDTAAGRKPHSKIGLASPFSCGQDGGVLLIVVEV